MILASKSKIIKIIRHNYSLGGGRTEKQETGVVITCIDKYLVSSATHCPWTLFVALVNQNKNETRREKLLIACFLEFTLAHALSQMLPITQTGGLRKRIVFKGERVGGIRAPVWSNSFTSVWSRSVSCLERKFIFIFISPFYFWWLGIKFCLIFSFIVV